jgi:hypothetical protein
MTHRFMGSKFMAYWRLTVSDFVTWKFHQWSFLGECDFQRGSGHPSRGEFTRVLVLGVFMLTGVDFLVWEWSEFVAGLFQLTRT